MSNPYHVGLDVHKESVSIAWAGPLGPPSFHGKCSSSNPAVEEALRKLAMKLGTELKDLKVAYEAGPTGFVLARHLLRLGVEVTVAAPSKIARAPGEKVKTDKRDSVKIARLHRAGELVAVHLPEVDDEAIRDVCRARTDASENTRRAKQQLKAFLLRNGYHYTGKANWGPVHLRWLRGLRMGSAAQTTVLEESIQAVDTAAARQIRMERHMERLLADWERKDEVADVMGLKGFRLVAAMTVVAELGDMGRFDHPRQLMGYLGLVPGEDSSGQRRRQGGITKCGNSHVRWMLVEAAHSYRLPAKVGGGLSDRQEGLSEAVRQLSWRAQTRLCAKYQKLKARRVHVNKVVTAVARELTSFLWELCRLRSSGEPAAG